MISALAMIFVVLYTIASFKINYLYSLGVLTIVSAVCLWGVYIWDKGNKKWKRFFVKYISISTVLTSFIIYSAIIHPMSALIIILSIILSVYSLKTYSKRNGVIRSYVSDANKQRVYLINNKESISMGKGFVNYQSLVYALDLEDEFVLTNDAGVCKIPTIKKIEAML